MESGWNEASSLDIAAAKNVQARIEQRGMNLIIFHVAIFRGGDADFRERFLMATTIPFDTLEGRPIFQSALTQRGIELGARAALLTALADFFQKVVRIGRVGYIRRLDAHVPRGVQRPSR